MKVLTFRLSGDLYGIDTELVREIIRNASFSPVPLAPHYVAGLVNLRGQIITLIDIGLLLGYPPERRGHTVTSVILKSKKESLEQTGFIIDKTGEVIDILGDVEEPPPNLDQWKKKAVLYTVNLGGEQLMVIGDNIIKGE